MYTYVNAQGHCGPDITDYITDVPEVKHLHYLCNSIWDWDLLVSVIEVSPYAAEKMGMKFDQNGERDINFAWDKCLITRFMSAPIKMVCKDLPKGVFAIAKSDFPKDFPASCWLTDEKRHNDRFYSVFHKGENNGEI